MTDGAHKASYDGPPDSRTSEAPRLAVIVSAAGSSARMGGVKKEYRYLPRNTAKSEAALVKETVLSAAVRVFVDTGLFCMVLVVYPPGGETEAREALAAGTLSPEAQARVQFIPGGPSRKSSVHKALKALEPFSPDFVLIHDGARPWTDAALIHRVTDAVLTCGAVIPVMPLVETPKEIDDQGLIVRHLRRACVVSAQTPQAFSFKGITAAHDRAADDGIEYTDDAEVWSAFTGPVHTVPGSAANRKITFPEDLE